MILNTLDRLFKKEQVIDSFNSFIWTERYVGNGDFQMSVPATDEMLSKLPKGQLVLEEDSKEPMILETRTIEDGNLTVSGINLVQWMNNRILRTNIDHTVREWLIQGLTPGQALSHIVQYMCMPSTFNDGTTDIDIASSVTTTWPIPGLSLGAVDASGDPVDISVSYGQVYDALKSIAEAYSVGQKIELVSTALTSYVLHYITYRGANRTSSQSVNPVIRFSNDMETLTNIKDLDDLSNFKNAVYAFAPGADPSLTPGARGANSLTGETGFDLRVFQTFLDNIPADVTTHAQLEAVILQQAQLELGSHKPVQLVDGEIVQTGQIQYGTHYFLGDIVEIKGNTGVLQNAQITEYIRSQDESGERSYPTLATLS